MEKHSLPEKNEVLQLTFTDLTEDGEGVARKDGFVWFVKGALPGDEAEVGVTRVKKNYGYARLIHVLKPSAVRVEPVCPAAVRCGGCQLQAMSYKAQLAFKKKKVEDLLSRTGGFENPPVEDVLGMEEPWGYRNKAAFPVVRGKNGRIITGFYAGRTHAVIETPKCFLGSSVNEEVMGCVIAFMESKGIEPYDEVTHTGLVRHVLIRTGNAGGREEVMVCLVINGNALPHAKELVNRLLAVPGMTDISVNINKKRTNVILGTELKSLFGPGYIHASIGDMTYRVSSMSFFQVNKRQTKVLYDIALEFAGLSGCENVWDLYCGTGTISLFLARKARYVRGVELVEAAVENARENARENGIENAGFFCGRAEDIFTEVYSQTGERADVVVVDPPRAGCDGRLLATMLDMAPDRIVYVSCNPATLARDLKILCEKKYALERVQPVDMFPHTVGVEACCLLRRAGN